jgi:transcriptional repressor NrdR
MRCPYCQHDNDSVRDSRVVEDGKAIRRRRVCNSCRRKFTTMERVSGTLYVIKKNRDREPFSRAKIERGLELACWKRKISADQRLAMAEAIESQLQEEFDLEVESTVIGERCMEHLERVDQVAFVRFASVYREFKDVRDFVQELQPILDRRSLYVDEGEL